MKIHDKIDDWMAGALCGALTPDEQQHFEQHLAECPHCRSLYEENRKMNDILKQTLPELRPDQNFERRVLAGFREKIAGRRFHPWRGLVWFVQFRAMQAALALLALAAMVRGGAMITGEGFPGGKAEIAHRGLTKQAIDGVIAQIRQASTSGGGTLQLGNGTTGNDGTIASAGKFGGLSAGKDALDAFSYQDGVDTDKLAPAMAPSANVGGGNGTPNITTTGSNTYSGSTVISALTIAGSGGQTLTGVNTYTGATLINGGALTINGTGINKNQLQTDSWTSADAGVISGMGAINGNVRTATNAGKKVTGSAGTNNEIPSSIVVAKAAREQSTKDSDRLYSTVDEMAFSGTTAATSQGQVAPLQTRQINGASEDVTGVLGSHHPWQTQLQRPQVANAVQPAPVDSRKLIRNASLDFEVPSFEKALDTITAVAGEEQGYVFSQNSAKGMNGKLQGQIIVKVLPPNLDRFLLKLRLLGDMKNQTVSAQDVSKDYYDTEARVRNSQVTEARLIDMMKTRTGRVSDLLEVENEISRVRGEIEQMQGQLKLYDAQVQYATVAITIQEKDINQTAAYMLKEEASLSLFAKDVEKAFTEAKTDAEAAKAQTIESHIQRDEDGRISATLHLLIPPDASDEAIAKLKAIGRIQNFNSQTQRVARDGSGNSETAKVEKDKVELSLVIQRDEENIVQGTNINVLTDKVEDKTAQIKQAAAAAGVEIKGAEFNRAQNGVEVSGMRLRMPMKKYAAFLEQIKALGKVKEFTVSRREDSTTSGDAPVEIGLQIYSEGNIVAEVGPDTGLWATVRHTVAEGFAALMWSVRMIGVSLAFIAPWGIALGLAAWVLVRRRRRLAKK